MHQGACVIHENTVSSCSTGTVHRQKCDRFGQLVACTVSLTENGGTYCLRTWLIWITHCSCTNLCTTVTHFWNAQKCHCLSISHGYIV